MPPKIFINYRKEDSPWNSLALYQELIEHFPKNNIFKDFNNIRPGSDFVETIENALEECDVLLVLISEKWLTIEDKKGNRRINNPDDYVKLEIATALKRDICIIPVLFDNAVLPQTDELPEDLKKLSRRQFIEIDKERFESDVAVLIEAIKAQVPDSEPGAPQPSAVKESAKIEKWKKNSIIKYTLIAFVFIAATVSIIMVYRHSAKKAQKNPVTAKREQDSIYNASLEEAKKKITAQQNAYKDSIDKPKKERPSIIDEKFDPDSIAKATKISKLKTRQAAQLKAFNDSMEKAKIAYLSMQRQDSMERALKKLYTDSLNHERMANELKYVRDSIEKANSIAREINRIQDSTAKENAKNANRSKETKKMDSNSKSDNQSRTAETHVTLKKTSFILPRDGQKNVGHKIGDFCCTGETATIYNSYREEIGYIYFFSYEGAKKIADRKFLATRFSLLVSAVSDINNADSPRVKGSLNYTAREFRGTAFKSVKVGALEFKMTVKNAEVSKDSTGEYNFYLMQSVSVQVDVRIADN